MQRSSTHMIRIGTRNSPLARNQARDVQDRLAAAHNVADTDKDRVFPIHPFTTTGDTLKGALTDFGGKGLFTKELERALIADEIDIAVHSMKDVPTVGQDSLQIGAVLEREDHRDGFISPSYDRLDALPQGALVGTASIRRQAQLAALRPDICFTLLRGSVGKRLEKLRAGVCEATFLACAGLNRLGQAHIITQIVPSDVMLNAPAQGAVGIEMRRDNTHIYDYIHPLNHMATHMTITAERAFLKALNGSCRTPIAALAHISENNLSLRGEVLSKDGKMRFSDHGTSASLSLTHAETLGQDMGLSLRETIGNHIQFDD